MEQSHQTQTPTTSSVTTRNSYKAGFWIASCFGVFFLATSLCLGGYVIMLTAESASRNLESEYFREQYHDLLRKNENQNNNGYLTPDPNSFIIPTKPSISNKDSSLLTVTTSGDESTAHVTSPVRFSFKFPANSAKPVLQRPTNYDGNFYVDVLGDKNPDKDTVGIHVTVLDAQVEGKENTRFPTDPEARARFLGELYTTNECGGLKGAEFEKIKTSNGKEILYASESMPCDISSSKGIYNQGAYVIKLSDRYYGLVLTSIINDRTIADKVASTLSLE